ncbi:MAG: DUF481 domain-containing protein [Alphaproteobacteria bacterium]|nr:DUF481 domain-containing protein [Alphaproteobacteria bacterium]
MATSRTSVLAALTACLAAMSATPARATELPGIAREAINAAARHEDPDRIRIVAEDIAAVLPSFREAILAYGESRIEALPPAIAEPAAATSPTAVAAPAADSDNEDDSDGILANWDGSASFGASFASGNSDNVAVGGALDATRKAGELTHHAKAYFDLGQSGGVTNQRRWGASYKLDIAFTEKAYAYIRGAYDEDEFSGFDYRLFAGAGVGYFIAKSEPFTLKLEGGPGYRYSPIDIGREVDRQLAGYGGLDLDWTIREGLKFEQDVSVTWTEPTTTTESRSRLSTTIFGDFSAGVAFNFRFETNPPAGRVRTDRVLRATLGYEF